MSDMNTSSRTSVYCISSLHGTENFNTWRIQMEDILTDLGLFEYVNGKTPFPPYDVDKVPDPTAKDADGKAIPGATKDVISTTMNMNQEKWMKEDQKALSQIRLRVDAHALTHIQSCNFSREAWSLLTNTFQVQGTVGLIDLRRKFFSHRMTDGEDVEEHMGKMRDWFQQINIILPHAISEVDWITTLVASLPDSWDSFTQSVDCNFDFKNINILNSKVADLRSRILAEAHRRNTRADSGKAFYGHNRPNFSNNTRSFNPSKPPPRTPDKSQSKCNNCGRTEHWAKECCQPGRGAYKQGNYKPQARNQGKSSFNRFMGPNNKRNNARAHAAINTNEAPMEPNDSFAFSAFDDKIGFLSRPSNQWIADSGTTTHIACDRSLFDGYRDAQGTVTGVSGKNPIIGRGNITLCCKNPATNEYETITLKDVAHVPSCPTNLISLSLVTDNGLGVQMSAKNLQILSPDGNTIAVGEKLTDRIKGNLWQLICDAVKPSKRIQSEIKKDQNEMVLTKVSGHTWYDWHRILGHIGAQALQKIQTMGAIIGMEVSEGKEGLDFQCESCIQAKMSVRPFPKESKTNITSIGQLIVTDVWGPARIPSIGKYLYYVSFTDVSTRFSTVAFLRQKDETLEEYKAFELFLLRQKKAKILKVRFDNGGKFVNQSWKAHTTKAGTVLETTAPYSSQQNGIAEKLNRTLLEHACAMMFESDAPKFLWSEAVAYACYLKNRVPTQVHGVFQLTPYERFRGTKPNVSLLRPWGTKCYVLDQAVNRSKLDPKAFKAVFTGILDVQGKSWRYYKPGAMRIYHSCNVAFLRDDDTMTSNEDEVLIPIAPPAEGEIKKISDKGSKPERLVRQPGQGETLSL
ncbi:integrase core domain protein [Ceratobasidium sp. AG-Ba]|nr:integrase core domain protein [Ceratobasidium sp. AG-Ba]